MGKSNYKMMAKSIKSSAVALGPRANAANTVTGLQIDREVLSRAIAESEHLIELLAARQREVANGDALLASAADVKKRLSKKTLKLNSIRKILEQIAEGVAGIGVLSDAVARVQTLIAHLAS